VNIAQPEKPDSRIGIPASRWYVLGILSAVSLFAYLDRMALAILLEPIKADLHLNDGQLGLLSGLAFAMFYATLGLPLARLADRASRVKLLSLCLIAWSVMTALSGMAKSFSWLFMARMGVGIGEAGCVPTAHSMIGDLFPRERRALAISIFQAGAAIGSTAGLFFVGALGQHLGWRASLQLVGLAGLPLSVLVFLTVREPTRPLVAASSGEPFLKALKVMIRRPALIHLILAYSVGAICTAGLMQWIPTYFIRSFGLSLAEAGALVGAATAFSSVLGLLTGGAMASWLMARDPRWEIWIPTLAFAICIPFFVLQFLSPTVALALVFGALGSYSAAIGAGVALAAVQSFVEPHRRATAVALLLFLSALLGTGLGPYLIGVVSDALAPSLGRESLRYALLGSCSALLWSVAHFAVSAAKSTRDRLN
jgi:MFS family permease